ncbi:MAG: oligoendopeptidase F family protein, partial [Anaerolineae bacterium]|nr:oligoendopeptidase F family protein [Anaerolineae bacterium]
MLYESRQDIPSRYKWDLSTIFPSDQDWEDEIKRVTALIEKLPSFQGQLSEPNTLLRWLKTWEELFRTLGKIRIYAHCHYSVNKADTAATVKMNRAMSLMAKAQAAAAFAEPEILTIGLNTLREWEKSLPELAVYDHYFENLYRLKKHVRTAEVEELLGQLLDPFRTSTNTHNILADTELTFQDAVSSQGEHFPVAQGTIGALRVHPDRKVRRTAWQSYADAHLSYKNTMANCLSAGVKQNVFLARTRRYDSALEAALSPSNIPTQVFHNVINTFQRNLPVWHRYWRLRRRALGYEKLHPYDIKAPLLQSTPKIPFEQAVEWICQGLEPMGKEYVEIIRRGIWNENWVDVYPNKGKASGAFSTGSPGTPPLILMSYNDDIYSLSTLAHELGHSIHSYYTWQTQPFVYSHYSLFVAEVASNFHQALVRDYLFRTQSERNFQIALLEEAFSNFHRYFFIMPTLARFELEIHRRTEQGIPLTAESLIECMAELFQEGFGQEVEMDKDRVGITWAQFHTHLYA